MVGLETGVSGGLDPQIQQTDAEEYIDSKGLGEHLEVVIERAMKGERGDFEVSNSMTAVLRKLGDFATMGDRLPMREAGDFVTVSRRLSELATAAQASRFGEVDPPHDPMILGMLVGAGRLFHDIIEHRTS